MRGGSWTARARKGRRRKQEKGMGAAESPANQAANSGAGGGAGPRGPHLRGRPRPIGVDAGGWEGATGEAGWAERPREGGDGTASGEEPALG